MTLPLIGWNNRKSKTINGSTAGAQANYQLQLTIYKSTGVDIDTNIYVDSKVRDDFGDVRFTESDGTTLLDYYIETLVSGVSATIWVKITTIPASPNTAIIYIYYNNPTATSLSSATNTLLNTATGGNITTNVQNRVHSFLINGTFTPEKNTNVKALVVAGGGSGGQGGAGAGGLLYNAALAVIGGTGYNTTIGAGALGRILNTGLNGSNSIFSTLTAIGGGGSGFGGLNGKTGGSGGGSGVHNVLTSPGSGTAGQGFAGGQNITSAPYPAGGGGGAGAVGQTAPSSAQSGNGGIGLSNDITGTATYYAGGGGGTGESGKTKGTGGLGGGGNGSNTGEKGDNGTANTGGGGGGGNNGALPRIGGDGGSGIVIISFAFRNFASPEPTYGSTGSEEPTLTTTTPYLGNIYLVVQRGISFAAGVGASLGRRKTKSR